MIGFAFVVLALTGLIAAVYGREAAQGCIRFAGFIVALCLISFACIVFFIYRADQQARAQAAAPVKNDWAGSKIKAFGFASQIASPDLCTRYGITYTGNSLYVTGTDSGLGAAAAGLPVGCIIVEVDNNAPDSQELSAVKAAHRSGDMIPFKLVTPDKKWWQYWVRMK
jgi:cbb3-type cytochrome oxidase subunit 3